MNNPPPLNLFLAKAGICSRRHAVEAIESGKVTVNDQIERNPGRRITSTDKVCFDEKPLCIANTSPLTIMLNKPAGYECSRPTIHTEHTIYDLVDIPDRRLFSIGRLDKDTEGLLLLTDDGNLANKLTHPSSEIPKIYELITKYRLTQDDAEAMEAGIVDEGETLKAVIVEPINVSRHLYHITLTEGKKREIRRLIRSVNNRTVQLKRLQIGKLKLGSLPLGSYRELTAADLALLQ